METSQRERLSVLVEELTTSGETQLNQEKVKELKKICRTSDDCIDHVYHSVMAQLNQEHAEIRLSAFQIASELFSRSHHFRNLLVDNFQEFLELTVETDLEQPLPPPKEVARKLRSSAIQTVQAWQVSYGSAYKKLALGYHFLKQVKKVDFQDAEARTVAERRREEERQRKMERIYKARVEAAAKEMEESCPEMEATLTEMESCMKLLLPDFIPSDFHTDGCSLDLQTVGEDSPQEEKPSCSKQLMDNRTGSDKKTKGDEVEEDEEASSNEEEADKAEEEEKEAKESSEEEEAVNGEAFIRNSGLISHAYSLDLNLSPGLRVKETEDNEAVVSMAKELHKLIRTKHLPAVQGWVQVFTKSGAAEQQLRRALDLKKSLEAALAKHKELQIDCKARVGEAMKAASDSEDEDEFEEVPEKEGYEPHIPEHLRSEYGLDPLPSTSKAAALPKPAPAKTTLPARSPSSSSSRRLKRLIEEEQDPTSAAATLRLLRQKIPASAASSSSTADQAASSSKQKHDDAPVVPFGLDLYYWGQKQPNAGKIIKSTSQHQFWVPIQAEEEVENEELLAESRSRYISFPGRFVPVSHFCRAPLGNGKLCQRQDRRKCPFHGEIIPRDETGRPCREEDRQREEEEERRKREQEPDWRDPELMREIEAATGEDLGSNRIGKKRKGKTKKYPNLSDLKQTTNTSRTRLERKVFNKSAMRRVAQVLSKADKRKHDKFSNQFNYALN